MAGIDSFTKLLLHMDNVPFTDTSASAHVTTPIGNAQIDTAQSKFGGASGLFDGTGDYVTTPNSADFDFGTGDFTIDFWVRREASTAYAGIVSTGNSSLTGKGYTLNFSSPSGNTVNFRFPASNPTSFLLAGTTTIALNTWTHVALARSGANLRLFINGVLDVINSSAGSVSFDSDGVGLFIGRLFSDLSNYYLTGHVDELRVSKGIARWTANFTPPTSKYTNDSYTKLLLHMDNIPFTDASASAHVTTPNGNAQISTTQSKFGGASALFDGSGDYLSIPDSVDWTFGTGDFTIDFWVKTNNNHAGVIVQGAPLGNDALASVVLYLDGSGYLVGSIGNGGTAYRATATTSITDSTWHHIAFVRDGNSLKIFVDGTLENSTDITGITVYDSSSPFIIGRYGDYTVSSWYYNGRLDEIRISKGIARWTTNFTPPTSEYTAPLPDVLPFIRTRNARPINKVPSDVLVW